MRAATRTPLVAVAVTVCCAVPGTASARVQPAPHPIATSFSPAITDGRRYVVYEPTATSLLLRDELTSGSRTISVAAGCEPLSGAFGTFLVSCPSASSPSSSYSLLQASTGALPPVPGAGTTWQANCTGFAKIGRYWLRGLTCIDSSEFFLDWRTGTAKSFATPPQTIDTRPRDLDSRDLHALGPAQENPEAAGAEGRFMVREVGSSRTNDFPDLVAFRHGTRYAVLDRCRHACLIVSLAGSRLTWTHRGGTVGFGYDLRSKRRFLWRLPSSITSTGPQGQQGFSGIQHTRTHLFFTTGTGQTSGPPYQYRIYAAGWPSSG